MPGQAHELASSLQLLKRPPKAPAWALADMACDAAEFRAAAEAMAPVVPSRTNAKQKQPCLGFIYRHLNLIRCCWARLKERRATATRYDKTATSYAAGIAIAATLDCRPASSSSVGARPCCVVRLPIRFAIVRVRVAGPARRLYRLRKSRRSVGMGLTVVSQKL